MSKVSTAVIRASSKVSRSSLWSIASAPFSPLKSFFTISSVFALSQVLQYLTEDGLT